MDLPQKTFIHRTFEIGILLKGLNGVLEICGGTLLLFIKPATINRLALQLTQGELSHDPRDRIANFLLQTSAGLSARSELYGSAFLLSHGLIKLFLIICLYKRQLWAYPAAIAVFGLFIGYQLYRFALDHSAWMVLLSILDAVVIALTYLEYQNLKNRAA